MIPVFVDITAIEALINRLNPNHDTARQFLETAVVRHFSLISCRQVLFLLANRMRAGAFSGVSADIIEALSQSELILFDHMTSEDETETWRIYRSMSGSWWTFSRCASFALINRLKIETVFGFDSVYRDFGLQLLPGKIKI